MNASREIEWLKKSFQVQKWPHYELLIGKLGELMALEGQNIAIYERTTLPEQLPEKRPDYRSRLGPFVEFLELCNHVWVVNHLMGHCSSKRYESPLVADETFDYIIVPNLLHHVRDQAGLWEELHDRLSPGGRLCVFDPCLREYHWHGVHYVNYTPAGVYAVMEDYGFENVLVQTTGTVFEAIAYFSEQATQAGYYGGDILKSSIDVGVHMNKVRHGEDLLIRPGASCPMAFWATGDRL